jgi:hypothetical protein
MNETHILITLLQMYFPWNWKFGSALSKLWNFGVYRGGGGFETPSPSVHQWFWRERVVMRAYNSHHDKNKDVMRYNTGSWILQGTVNMTTKSSNITKRKIIQLADLLKNDCSVISESPH